jgi:hypothetical protein
MRKIGADAADALTRRVYALWRAGLVALGMDVDGPSRMEAELRHTADPFPVVGRTYACLCLLWCAGLRRGSSGAHHGEESCNG